MPKADCTETLSCLTACERAARSPASLKGTSPSLPAESGQWVFLFGEGFVRKCLLQKPPWQHGWEAGASVHVYRVPLSPPPLLWEEVTLKTPCPPLAWHLLLPVPVTLLEHCWSVSRHGRLHRSLSSETHCPTLCLPKEAVEKYASDKYGLPGQARLCWHRVAALAQGLSEPESQKPTAS